MNYLIINSIKILIFCLLSSTSIASPLFENSVVSNDIDFIQSSDFTVSACIDYLGTSRQEMPDKRHDELFDNHAYTFFMEFKDGTGLAAFAHSDFVSSNEAEKYINMLAGPIGKLPNAMRHSLSHVIVHKGNETAFAEHLGNFWVVYSDNMETRISHHDLEETVFHESVHATLDKRYKDSADWLSAQKADDRFVTRYALNNPNTEDFAETALFAYALLKYPNRLPPHIEQWLVTHIPHRINFFENLYKVLDTRQEQ